MMFSKVEIEKLTSDAEMIANEFAANPAEYLANAKPMAFVFEGTTEGEFDFMEDYILASIDEKDEKTFYEAWEAIKQAVL